MYCSDRKWLIWSGRPEFEFWEEAGRLSLTGRADSGPISCTRCVRAAWFMQGSCQGLKLCGTALCFAVCPLAAADVSAALAAVKRLFTVSMAWLFMTSRDMNMFLKTIRNEFKFGEKMQFFCKQLCGQFIFFNTYLMVYDTCVRTREVPREDCLIWNGLDDLFLRCVQNFWSNLI